MPRKSKAVKLVVVKGASRKKPAVSSMKRRSAPKRRANSGLLSTLGGIAGNLFAGPAGGSIGMAAGDLISRITGFGAYQVNSNSISAGNSIPTFRDSGQGVRICHREFLDNVFGSEDFSSKVYPINPGLALTCPWLSLVAQNFEEYEFLGLVFEYRPSSGSAVSSTSSALGVVIMATDYDALNPPFANKQSMESYQFSTSTVPFTAALHPVECARNRNVLDNLYVRKGDIPVDADRRMYDMGNFQIATQGMQSVYVVGELWIAYEYLGKKPRLPASLFTSALYARFRESPDASATSGLPFGTTGALKSSDSNLDSVTGVAGGANLLFSEEGNYVVAIYVNVAGADLSVVSLTTGGNIATGPLLFRDLSSALCNTINSDGIGGSYLVSATVTSAGTGAANHFTPTMTFASIATVDVVVVKLAPLANPLPLPPELPDRLWPTRVVRREEKKEEPEFIKV